MSNSTSSSNTQQDVFGYTANQPMAWIGGIVFSLLFIIHVFQYFKHRAFYLYLFLFGTAMEVCGYWTRVVVIRNPENTAAAAMSYLLITLAPSFVAAALYMTFGRIIFWVAPDDKRSARYTWVPARFLTIFFVTWDMLGFVISCIGVFVLIANANKKELTVDQQINGMNITYKILQVAFIWQIIAFTAFWIVAFRFMFSSKTWKYDWPNSGTWRKMAWVVVITSALVTGRSLYRTLTFSLNLGNNYLRNNEWTFYMFDFIPMLVVLVLFSLVHPGLQMPAAYTGLSQSFRKSGFRVDLSEKTVRTEVTTPNNGYARVTLAPPPIRTQSISHETTQTQIYTSQESAVPRTSMNFHDPWNNRPSPGADRY